MKNLIYIPIILVTLLFCQCNSKRNTTITIKNTTATNSLKGRSIKVSEDLLMPVKVFAIDDKLVVFDRVNSDFFKVFKIPEMELLYSFGSKGRGPNEFSHIDPNSMKVVGNKICLLDGNTLKYLNVGNDKITVEQSKTIVMGQAPTNRLLVLNDSIYISDILGDNLEHEFQRVNLNQRKIEKTFGDYPDEGIRLKNDIEKYQTYMKASASSPKGDKIISFYLNFNRFKILDNQGKLLKEVVIESNLPKYKPKDPKSSVIYRSEPFATKDFVYVLAIEQVQNEVMSNISSFKPKLEIWNWEGELQAKYLLDKPIITFTISEENSKLYGTSIADPNKLYEFNLTR